MKKIKINTIHLTTCLALTAMLTGCQYKHSIQKEENKIIVYLQLSARLAHPEPQNFALKDKMEMAYLPVTNTEDRPKWQSVNAVAYNGYVKWTMYSAEPVKINYGFGSLPIVSPGDSIVVRYNGEEYEYSGKGSDKLICWYKMRKTGRENAVPTESNNYIRSLEEYLKWNHYLNNKLALQIPLLDSYKDKITLFEYEYLKATAVSLIESDRIQTFKAFRSYVKKDAVSRISLSDLNAIWDSTQYHPLNNWHQAIADYYGDIYNISEYNIQEVWRQFNFDASNDSLKSKELRHYLYYLHAKQKYKGLLRERLLVDIIAEQTKTGNKDPLSQKMLQDYFNEPGFPEYKKQIKALEEKVSEKLAKK